VGAWPAARAFSCPSSQYERAADAPVPVSQYKVMLSIDDVESLAEIVGDGIGGGDDVIAGLTYGKASRSTREPPATPAPNVTAHPKTTSSEFDRPEL
jgi:hypothetical protein